MSVVCECFEFYAVPTVRVIFTAKTSLDIFNLRLKQVWTYSILVGNKFGLFQSLGDRIYEMKCLFVAVGLFIVLPH